MKSIKKPFKKSIKFFKSHRKLVVIILATIVFVSIAAYFIFLSFDKKVIGDTYSPQDREVLNNNLEAQVLFNNEAGVQKFSPEIISLIRNAQSTIDVAMYSMDSLEIRDELIKAANRGVVVRFVVSYNKQIQYRNLFVDKPKNLYVSEIAADSNEGFMHNKFIISDANREGAALITGSFNSTKLQEMYDPSFIFKTEDRKIVSVYEQEFQRLFNGKTGRKKLNDVNYKAWQADLSYSNGNMEIWWSPGSAKNNFKVRLLDLISRAKESIDVMIWQVTDEDMISALINKAVSGVKVRVITDDSNAWLEASKIPGLVSASLKNSNLVVIDDAARTQDFLREIFVDESVDKNNFNSFFHHHALIIDKKILAAGSGNWSYRANYSNDENALVTTVPNLVNDYQKSFDFNFNKLHGEDLEIKVDRGNITVNGLNKFSGLKLLVLQEDPKLQPISQVCTEVLISGDLTIIRLPAACLDKALNVFVLNSRGQVMANKLLGKIE